MFGVCEKAVSCANPFCAPSGLLVKVPAPFAGLPGYCSEYEPAAFVYAVSVPSAEKSAAAGAFDACADEAVSFEQGLCAQKAFGVCERSFAAGQQPSCGGLTGFIVLSFGCSGAKEAFDAGGVL